MFRCDVAVITVMVSAPPSQIMVAAVAAFPVISVMAACAVMVTDAVTVIIVMAVAFVAVITVMAGAAVVTAELAWHMFGVQVNRIWGKRSLASLGEGKIRVRDRWLILRTSWAQVHKRFVIACVEGLPMLVAFVCLDSIS